jgi:hypothetical protein
VGKAFGSHRLDMDRRLVITTYIAVTNASGYSKRVLKEAETYGVQMVSRKTLEKLLKKFPVTRGQIQRRLLEPRLFE